MDEEDWQEIVQLVQKKLVKLGHESLADLSNYEIHEGTERFFPESRYLVKEMLDGLHRVLSARSTVTVQNSLAQLGDLIDEGLKPTDAVVWSDEHRSSIEGRDPMQRLVGDENVPEALFDLEFLIGQISEIAARGEFE